MQNTGKRTGMPHAAANESVLRGRWGEDVAAERLRREGLLIIERNVRPFVHDRRLEIDIVAYDPRFDTMIFVEVKQHSSRREGDSRLRSVNRSKKAKMRVACNAWRRKNRWQGNYRFDVVEVYGSPGGGRAEVDHMESVNIFVPPERFALWA